MYAPVYNNNKQLYSLLYCEMVFRVGFFALVWYAAWEYIAYDTPANHPTISKAERFYIEDSIGGRAFDPSVSTL